MLILKILKGLDKNQYCKTFPPAKENTVKPAKIVFGQQERRQENILFAQDKF